ncbi:MAG: RiPP maturation radical SAM C-methyltransferase [Nitrosomonas sp.]|uniref:RiPP maturation radical SAM C-methyltransferase n=1 Tax=Nitrosomonas sp. TaxID=42353 RepID=UPI0025CE9629|nr:RiPP maturation radical SAM C-methyltransferase [Nitrosomonas sp.]MBY0473994.1 RiPP maturation radical SAM C-methyltransferase [Nitrosomonas sp.]
MRKTDRNSKLSVALVNMPVSSTGYPNLGLSLLKSQLTDRGIASKVFYFNLMYADFCDLELNRELSNGAPRPTDLASEWLFREIAWGANSDLDLRYLNEVLRGHNLDHTSNGVRPTEGFIEKLVSLRMHSDKFIHRCLDSCDWGQFRIVGFSSVFQQQLASVALAKLIKKKWPNIVIVFGGANVDGPAAETVVNHFGPVDVVFRGEADIAFPRFVQALLDDRPIAQIDGMVVSNSFGKLLRRSSSAESSQSVVQFHKSNEQVNPLITLNDLPYPDFEDFFEQRLGREQIIESPSLVFEGSRGCWWGAKSHCTFCGLNATTMTFRQKTSERALAEVDFLISRYGGITKAFVTSDNILPINYLRTFLPKLVGRHKGATFFYEIKANLTRLDVAVLSAAGVDTIQPGIESLHSSLLTIMKKGVSGIQNVQLLKWCIEYDIRPLWNILVGFPGANECVYSEMASLVPALSHLPPPNGVADVRFDRFSPYTYNPTAHGLSNLRPYHSYSLIYPHLPQDELGKIAYYYVGDFNEKDSIPRNTQKLRQEVSKWKAIHKTASLRLLEIGSEGHVFDNRWGQATLHKVSDIDCAILKETNDIRSISSVVQKISQLTSYDGESVHQAILRMAYGQNQLILIEGNRVLALTLFNDSDSSRDESEPDKQLSVGESFELP